MFLGVWKIDDYLPIPATCHRFSTGAAYAPSALTYSIYESGVITPGTGRIDNNVDMTPASPFDSIVGCYLARRQLTTAAGFEAGKEYEVVIKATVDSISAIEMHHFKVEAALPSDVYTRLGAPSGASVLADLKAILPAALVGGRMDSYIGAIDATLLEDPADLVAAVAAALLLIPENKIDNGTGGVVSASISQTIAEYVVSLVVEAMATAPIGSVAGNVGGNVAGSVGSIGATGLSGILAQLESALAAARTELSVGAPSDTPSALAMLMWLYMRSKNARSATALTATTAKESTCKADGTPIAEQAITKGTTLTTISKAGAPTP